MAAASYYQTEARPVTPQQVSSPYLGPPSHQPQRASSHGGFDNPYMQPSPHSSPHHQPQYPPPPPYQGPLDSAKLPHVQFAPTPPPSAPQRNSFSYPQRPSPQSWNGSYNMSQSNLHLAPPPSGLHSQWQPPANQQYRPDDLRPPRAPYMQQNYSSSSLSSGGGYASDPEPRRRRHSHRKTRERGHSDTGRSRSETTNGLLGAAGGGLIGDLIFPGLGTVGGALAGWLGGKDYGKHKRQKDEQREKAQRDWERKFGSRDGSRHREGGHHYDEQGHRRSDERRRSRDDR